MTEAKYNRAFLNATVCYNCGLSYMFAAHRYGGMSWPTAIGLGVLWAVMLWLVRRVIDTVIA